MGRETPRQRRREGGDDEGRKAAMAVFSPISASATPRASMTSESSGKESEMLKPEMETHTIAAAIARVSPKEVRAEFPLAAS